MSARRGMAKDLTGRLFGRLLVISRSGTKSNQAMWLCRCTCGAEKEVCGHSLNSGKTRSCGCFQREETTRRSKGKFDPLSVRRQPEYLSWGAMCSRCMRPDDPSFRNYGGRGITVCDRWLNGDGDRIGFWCFLADMGFRPTPLHSLDRVNNDGNYEPSNCRWATRSEQRRNQRSRLKPLPDSVIETATSDRYYKNGLTAVRVRELLDYDSATGVLTWKARELRLGHHWHDKIWNARFSGKRAGWSAGRYAGICIDDSKYLAHRVAWLHHYGEWPTLDIDHIDGDGHNNAISNLRQASLSQNLRNTKRRKSTTGIRGVGFDKRTQRYSARIVLNGQTYSLGSSFTTADEARDAYRAAAIRLHGEFAHSSVTEHMA